METLIKRKGLLTSMVEKSVNEIFDEYNTRDASDWTVKKISAKASKLPSKNLNETNTNIEVELVAPGMKKEEFSKKDSYTRKEFNYRSFCRLPNF